MGCGWSFDYASCTEKELGFVEGADSDVREQGEALAGAFLDAWTGGVFGLCRAQVRPCREGEPCGFGGGSFGSARSTPWQPVVIGGSWYNVSCGRCTAGCSCENVEFLELPYPTHEVIRVYEDGKELPGEAWELNEHRWLIRKDGGTWGTCQDMSLPYTQEGTFMIELDFGFPVPAAGRIAGGVLAVEFMKALCKDSTCKLPERVKTVSRQGVTVTLQDSFDDLQRGQTGIWLVDSWVQSLRGATAPRVVMSPDSRPKPYRTVRAW